MTGEWVGDDLNAKETLRGDVAAALRSGGLVRVAFFIVVLVLIGEAEEEGLEHCKDLGPSGDGALVRRFHHRGLVDRLFNQTANRGVVRCGKEEDAEEGFELSQARLTELGGGENAYALTRGG